LFETGNCHRSAMMKIGLVGLGKMGGNMARRLQRGGVDVVGYNRNPDVTAALAEETGLTAADSLPALVAGLAPPRVVWMMLPAGEVTQQYLDQLAGMLETGDVIVDGANSYFKDSMRRAEQLEARGLQFVDAGVSGGVWGLQNGYALMLGGTPTAVAHLEPVITALAPAQGWVHCGPSGSGHFVKMIHNGIEYGMMQAYAEGFAMLRAREDFALDLAAISESWRHGSVVRSWLLDLSADILARDQKLDGIEPFVADSGEGRWTVLESVEQGVPAPVISLALMMRFASQGNNDYADRLLAMMRQAFGGHAVKSGD
jgi:6-phosphogluconate dehydrogenase